MFGFFWSKLFVAFKLFNTLFFLENNLVKFLLCGDFLSNILSLPSLNNFMACLHFFLQSFYENLEIFVATEKRKKSLV